MSTATQSSAAMKPGPNPSESLALLAFAAHPDDVELGCGAIVAALTAAGHRAHIVTCSGGEAGSQGTAEQRRGEAEAAAAILRAGLEWITLDGDARLEIKSAHAIQLAAIIRQRRPRVVLAPTRVENQHPDHWRLGMLVSDAVRLARYGGLADLREWPAYSVPSLLYYALSPAAEPPGITPILFDISAPAVLSAWKSSMEAHASQCRNRNYVEMQMARARVRGLSAGVAYAMPLYPNDPLLLKSFQPLLPVEEAR